MEVHLNVLKIVSMCFLLFVVVQMFSSFFFFYLPLRLLLWDWLLDKCRTVDLQH